MLSVFTKDQIKVLTDRIQYEKQQDFAASGIGTAIVNNRIVTIGDSECDYLDWKHFVVDQIFRMGISQYCAKADWIVPDLKEALAETDQDDDIWWDDAQDYFEGMKGDY